MVFLSSSQKIFITKLRWFASEKLSSVFDFFLFLFHVPVPGKPTTTRKKHLVFVGEMLPPRIPRMAKWIKRTGEFSITLLCHKRGFYEKFSNDSFDSVFLFRNAWHLKRILRSLPDISILHGFAPKSYYCNIARQRVRCPYLHDMQDVYAIYYGLNPSLRWLKKELPHERECLEKAAGIIAHSLEPNVALRMNGVKKKPKTLFFPLYCDDDAFQVPADKKINPDNIHLVYAGGVAGSHRNPAQYGNIQFQGLIKTLSEQKIHFHIYPSPSNIRADYEEYEKQEKSNPCFHFHPPVSQEELSKELGKYDFGILPFFKDLSDQSDAKLKYATTLKVFNYLEAGIPILVSKDIAYQSWIVSRYRCGISVSKTQLSSLKSILSVLPQAEFRGNIHETRESLSLKKNISKLMKFYSDICS